MRASPVRRGGVWHPRCGEALAIPLTTAPGGLAMPLTSLAPSEDAAARAGEAPGIGSLWPFFRPRSVAVIGASRHPSAIGHRLLESVVQGHFQGPIYPINPRAEVLAGLPAYASVWE